MKCSTAARNRRKRALVIEDDQDVVTLVAAILVCHGYDVYPACDGQECTQRLTEVHPHVVILDVILPKIDGWTVLQRIRACSDVPVVMLTGLADHSNEARARALGAVDYVAKPFDSYDLATRVEAAASGREFA